MSKPDTPEVKGCTDGGCIFGHPGGMHTNGGCRCLRSIGPLSETSRRVHRNILLLRQEIERLREQSEERLHALDHISTCNVTKMCPDCRRLSGGVIGTSQPSPT